MFLGDSDGGELCVVILMLLGMLWWGDALTRNHARLRQLGLSVGAATFIFFVAYHLLIAPPFASADILLLVVRGLALAVLATGLGWCVASPVAAIYDATLAPLTRCLREWRKQRLCRMEAAAEAQRKCIEDQRRKEEYERAAPERARHAAEAAARAAKSAEDHKRREAARAACEIHFSIYGPDIAERFTRDDMDRFFSVYMNESQYPDDVEHRGKELQRVIDEHWRSAKPQPKQLSLAALSEWYLEQKQRVEALPLSDEEKQTFLWRFSERYAELSQSLLESARP